jgi:hypothetical protein
VGLEDTAKYLVIKSRLNSAKCLHLFSSESPFLLLPEHVNTILPLVLCACRTWSSYYGKNTYSECLRTGCLEEYLDVRRKKRREAGEICAARRCLICVLCQILGRSNEGGLDVGHVERMEELRYASKILDGMREGKRQLERPRHR